MVWSLVIIVVLAVGVEGDGVVVLFFEHDVEVSGGFCCGVFMDERVLVVVFVYVWI